jgi:general secretion pathway protein K
LRQVLGMTDAVYRRIARHLTLYSGQSGINSSIAAREVLLAIPGVDPAAVDAYLIARNLPPGQPIPIFLPAQAFLSGDANVVSIVSDVKLSDNSRFIREAVLRVEQNPKQPAVFLAWRSPAARMVMASQLPPLDENRQDGQQ